MREIIKTMQDEIIEEKRDIIGYVTICEQIFGVEFSLF